jgi:hypothetical protein
MLYGPWSSFFEKVICYAYLFCDDYGYMSQRRKGFERREEKKEIERD